MNIPTLLKDLFFKVEHRPLQVPVDYNFVKVERYQVISTRAGVLGVKPAWRHDANPQPPALGRHLVFDHEQADALTQELYDQTFAKKPMPMHWVGSPPAGEKGPVGAWAAVLYGHAGYTVADVLRSPTLRESKGGKTIVADWELWERALLDETDADYSKELAAFEPALAFTNGYDYDDELTFYVLVTLPATTRDEEEFGSWGGAQAASRPHRPVLVLKTGQFATKWVKQLHSLTGEPLLEEARKALPELAQKFRTALREFAKLYYYLRLTPVKPEQLVPVVLDLYDTNRNLSTLNEDDALRQRVNRRVTAARSFLRAQSPNLAALVHFFMYEDAFDPTAFNRQTAEHALSERDVYRRLRTRLHKDVVSSERRLGLYLEGQKLSWENIVRGL